MHPLQFAQSTWVATAPRGAWLGRRVMWTGSSRSIFQIVKCIRVCLQQQQLEDIGPILAEVLQRLEGIEELYQLSISLSIPCTLPRLGLHGHM